ncbi:MULTISPECIES: hypothetical protein [Mycobacteroides]|jgi:hypothetical protein|uniref:UsfY protein n=1 Tax=Mycobacteroides chelonae TaxID=1774 RepID=A0AB73LHB9_MYCCH|nr:MULTISPECIES: hypothetical protein [Mycobacteroides]KRQ31283.1 hypothetical protein AOT86_01320 [Mycobacteroides sp. H072]KRQ35960.1 hypothetical protein AOT84_15790 [Mycobacteroides sp. H002]KRQ50502.1 hypothetical protein AOT85_13440 [Mycobacteroides sp. H054]KRQ72735.1 hypothetical protein AOT83_05080 [Mycobacteroides sp. H001]MBN7369281.1 hypothetical protein [Mycobacteroides abscessus subsp. abscessus]
MDTKAGQWIGSLMFAGGLVAAFLSGQVAKDGGQAVTCFIVAIVGLIIYLASVGRSLSEHAREAERDDDQRGRR